MEDEIKKVLIENLFACTESKELTKDRIVEIASEIAPFIVKVVNEQLEKSSNNDLEAEIEMVRKCHFINDDFDKVELEGRIISNIARHFAKWQKEQMMKDAVTCGGDGWFIDNKRNCRKNGKFHKYYQSTITHDKPLMMDGGTKYKLIIIKDE